MSVVRIGTTKKYSDNWDKIFGGNSGRTATKKKSTKAVKPSAKKKAVKVKATAKPSKKARKKK